MLPTTYILNKKEQKIMDEILSKYYMPPVIETVNQYSQEYGLVKTFNFLHDIIKSCQPKVEVFLDQRLELGQIKNKDQARKSIVGSIFPSIIIYLFFNLQAKWFSKAKYIYNFEHQKSRF